MAKFKFSMHRTVIADVVTPITVNAESEEEACKKIKECMDNECIPGYKVEGVSFGEQKLSPYYDSMPADYSHQLDDDICTIYDESHERIWGDACEEDW